MKQYASISDQHRTFIAQQQMYFVGTAARDGRVNVSPKGLDSLRVVGDNRVLWLNGTGSGNETAAHLLDTPRMTLMFCAFAGKPLILRLYGTARALVIGGNSARASSQPGSPSCSARNVFDLDVDLVQTSCGFGVPLYDFVEQRTLMDSWAENKGRDGVRSYQQRKNQASIDGYPTGLPAGLTT